MSHGTIKKRNSHARNRSVYWSRIVAQLVPYMYQEQNREEYAQWRVPRSLQIGKYESSPLGNVHDGSHPPEYDTANKRDRPIKERVVIPVHKEKNVNNHRMERYLIVLNRMKHS